MTPEELRGRMTLNVQEAADLLGISRNSAYEAIKRGEIHHVRVGSRIIVPVRPLLAQLGLEPSQQ